MTTNHLAYKPQPVAPIVAAGVTVKEICTAPSYPQAGKVQENTRKPAARSRWNFRDFMEIALDILLPSRWPENQFDTPSDQRPPVMIYTLGEPHLVLDARHRRPDAPRG
jgi:hypothetical protein